MTNQQFQSTVDAAKTAHKALWDSDYGLHTKAMDFLYIETGRIKGVNIGFKVANQAAEKEDWDTCQDYMKYVYSSMPITWARTWEISSMFEVKFILQTLLDAEDMADEGSAANSLVSRALEYVIENGSREERLAVMKGANQKLNEIVTSLLGITMKTIDVEAYAKALGTLAGRCWLVVGTKSMNSNNL